MKKTYLTLASALFATTMAQATITTYNVTMNGASESPANASPGVGSGTITLDDALFQMGMNFSFSGLSGNTTAAHIHAATAVAFAGTAGVATQTPYFVGFPIGVTSGTYSNTYDMALSASYNGSYITANGGTPLAAFAALKTAADNGKAYLNIHTSAFGGGEIRGFLTAVPEPTSFGLIGLGTCVLGLIRRRK